MDNHDYPRELKNSAVGEEKAQAQQEARENTEKLLRNSGIDPVVFYENFEFVDQMIQAFIDKVSTGFHVIKVSFPGNDTMIIIKDESGETKVSDNVSGFATHLAIGIIARTNFGLEMRSYLNGGLETPESLTPETSQELRSWMIKEKTINPFSAQQCIDTHCTDLHTGKFLEPERNVAYREGWYLVDGKEGKNEESLS